MTPDTFTRADIPAHACAEGIKWLDAHWPKGRETWTVREALEAGCDLGHAIWALALREDNRRLIVAFACDCAERVLPIFEARYPDDTRPRHAIETTRAWWRGEASIDDVKAAAAYASASYDAAAYAAYDAAAYVRDAYSAANAAYAAFAAAYAAHSAANAARDAHSAAYAAYDAYDAEREWQRARLIEMLQHQTMGGNR